MDDLRQRFATLDGVPVPDVWSDVERRLDRLRTNAAPRRLVGIKPEWRGTSPDTSLGSANALGHRRTVWLLLAAALLAALLVGGALVVGSGLERLWNVVPPSPDRSVVVSPSPSSPAAGSGSWTPTGNLVETRFGETATLLPNGNVLVVGGNPQFNHRGLSRATAEVYDASTGGWTLTGNMREAREGHAAVRLANGQVLVLGGGNADVRPARLLSSAELYDPSTGAWTDTGGLTSTRTNATATLLPDGRVLVTGGVSKGPDSPERKAEIYDPVTGTWAKIAAMSVARNGHTATVLPDGHVLVAGGGCCGDKARASAELYDPGSGTWAPTGSLAAGRVYHTAALLANGKVLVYGGDNRGNQSSTVTTAEIYDPVTGVWVDTGSPHQGNLFEAGQPARLSDGRVLAATYGGGGELYDPSSGSWTTVGGLSGDTYTYVHTSTLLADGRVLVTSEQWPAAGGGPLPVAALFDPDGTP
jgi:hypothetical protein